MVEGNFFPKGFFPSGYWAEGYWPDGAEVVEDDAGAGWWYFPELRRSMGFDQVPVPALEIPAANGVLWASIGTLGLEGSGVTLHPPVPLELPSVPEVRLPPKQAAMGVGNAQLQPFTVIGAGRGDLARGVGEATVFRPDAIGAGVVGTVGAGRADVGVTLSLQARMDHDVCTEEELLALVAVARVQLDSMDITEEELLALVSVATQQFWERPRP